MSARRVLILGAVPLLIYDVVLIRQSSVQDGSSMLDLLAYVAANGDAGAAAFAD